jgi:hypothetical protein
MHTYRGRQGADVALLIRRLKDACEATSVQCIGTSATMTTRGRRASSGAGRRRGRDHVLRHPGRRGERHRRDAGADHRSGGYRPWSRLRGSPRIPRPRRLRGPSPLTRWQPGSRRSSASSRVRRQASPRRRRRPLTVPEAARAAAEQTGADEDGARQAIKDALQAGSRIINPATGRPVFAFRLHQFLSKGDNVYVTLEPRRPGTSPAPIRSPRRDRARPGCAAADLGADRVLPRVRPGVPGRDPERYRRRAPVCGPPG